MAIVLGKDGSAPPFGTDIISATFTEECEAVDVTNRTNCSGGTGTPGYRVFDAGFKSEMWEIECHDPTGLMASLATNGTQWAATSVTENINVDGAVTYTVTTREL